MVLFVSFVFIFIELPVVPADEAAPLQEVDSQTIRKLTNTQLCVQA